MAKTKNKTSSKNSAKNTSTDPAPASAAKDLKKKKATSTPIESKSVVAEVVDDEGELPALDSSSMEAASEAAFDIDEKALEPQALEHEKSKGVSSSDPLAIYLSEIRRYRVLSRAEEQSLAQRYFESKDPEAAEALVKANLRFVVKVAADYSKFGAKMIDLIQEGNVGLMHAVREFNPYKGARLITYAVWWIRGYIQEYLMRQYSMVRIGTTQNQRKLFYQLQKEKEALDAMGIEPSMALISSRLGIPENEVRDMALRMSGRDISLDRPLDDDSSTNLGDLQNNHNDIPLDEALAHAEQLLILKEKIEAMRPELSAREIIILDERILNEAPLTLQEIGEKYGITREAVRQMEARLMKKIRTKMTDEIED